MKNYLLLILCCFFSESIYSQTQCQGFDGNTGGDSPPGCFLCEQNYRGSTVGHSSDSVKFDFPCGTIENKQWFSIYPDKNGIISINFLSVNCRDGQGIQGAIYDSNLNLVSDCFSTVNNNIQDSILITGLLSNQPYHVLVSGIYGDFCGFHITSLLNPEFTNIDTIVCTGSCFTYKDSCYFEATDIPFYSPCPDLRLNILHADTGDFKITQFVDSFTNSISFNWNVLGADSFDIFIDDVFINTQSFSSFLLPITSDLIIPFKFRVVPRSALGCPFKTSEVEFTDGSSNILEKQRVENMISIVPNPSKDIFKITSKTEILETAVFNLNGTKMMEPDTSEINLSAYPNGIYFLKIYTTEGVVLKRVLKI